MSTTVLAGMLGTSSTALAGAVFCISGALSLGKKELAALLEAHGATVASSVTAKVTHLLTSAADATKKTSKIASAEAKNIPVIGERFVVASITAGALAEAGDHHPLNSGGFGCKRDRESGTPPSELPMPKLQRKSAIAAADEAAAQDGELRLHDASWPKVFIRADSARFGEEAVEYFGTVLGALEFATAEKGISCPVGEDPVKFLSKHFTYDATILNNQRQVDGHTKIEEIYAQAHEEGDSPGSVMDETVFDDDLMADADYVLGMMKSWVQVEEDENNGPAGACPLQVCSMDTISKNQPFLLETCKIWCAASTLAWVVDEQLKSDKGFVLSVFDTVKASTQDLEAILDYLPEKLKEDAAILARVEEKDGSDDTANVEEEDGGAK